MKYILILCALVLTGCSTTVPVTSKFPDAPPLMMEKCAKLETIDKPNVLFSEFLKTVTGNYTKYHSCAQVVEMWQEWYTKQKEIQEKVSK